MVNAPMSDPHNSPPLPFGVHIPFVEHLGFEMVFFEGGRSEMRSEEHTSELQSH